MARIIVTNDDGVHAPGIMALVTAMRAFGEVDVIAPSINQSSSGHKKTLFQDIPVSKTTLADGTPAFSVGGSPADGIALAALGLVEWPPALVVSGINRGANMGQDITYSGTVTAALESTINGVPAVAVSLARRDANAVEDYAEAARVAALVVGEALNRAIPPLTVLNVNVPNLPRVRGIRLTRQGVRLYHESLIVNGELYRMDGPEPTGMFDEIGTDLWAVHQGFASLTPIHLDMTAHRLLADLAAWDVTV